MNIDNIYQFTAENLSELIADFEFLKFFEKFLNIGSIIHLQMVDCNLLMHMNLTCICI